MKRDESKNLELYSPEVFQILMEYEINRSRRYPSPLSLLNVIILPDGQNPAVQDALDAAISNMINIHLRSADIPSKRNDQFLILLPTTHEQGGRAVCERLLSMFKGLVHTESGVAFRATVFIGLASHPGGGDISPEILLQQAAAALKHARTQGISTYSVYSEIKKNTNL